MLAMRWFYATFLCFLATQIHASETVSLKTLTAHEISADTENSASVKQVYQRKIAENVSYPHFDDNPYITAEMHKDMAPYLLPLDHPAQSTLEKLFTDIRVINNKASLIKKGFEVISQNTSSHLLVVRHPKLKGYLLKIHPHQEHRRRSGQPAWKGFVTRCIYADKIRNLIEQQSLKHFVVPHKWIYPLPHTHINYRHSAQQRVILVVEDMQLVSTQKSAQAWRKGISMGHLNELYAILSRKYSSTALPRNIPHTKDGKFACIDTEFKRKMNLNSVYKYISDELKLHWQHLIQNTQQK